MNCSLKVMPKHLNRFEGVLLLNHSSVLLVVLLHQPASVELHLAFTEYSVLRSCSHVCSTPTSRDSNIAELYL